MGKFEGPEKAGKAENSPLIAFNNPSNCAKMGNIMNYTKTL
jgi:hypothetical protein